MDYYYYFILSSQFSCHGATDLLDETLIWLDVYDYGVFLVSVIVIGSHAIVIVSYVDTDHLWKVSYITWSGDAENEGVVTASEELSRVMC